MCELPLRLLAFHINALGRKALGAQILLLQHSAKIGQHTQTAALMTGLLLHAICSTLQLHRSGKHIFRATVFVTLKCVLSMQQCARTSGAVHVTPIVLGMIHAYLLVYAIR